MSRISKADFVAMSKSRSHESDLGNRSEHSTLSDSQTEVRLDPGESHCDHAFSFSAGLSRKCPKFGFLLFSSVSDPDSPIPDPKDLKC